MNEVLVAVRRPDGEWGLRLDGHWEICSTQEVAWQLLLKRLMEMDDE